VLLDSSFVLVGDLDAATLLCTASSIDIAFKHEAPAFSATPGLIFLSLPENKRKVIKIESGAQLFSSIRHVIEISDAAI